MDQCSTHSKITYPQDTHKRSGRRVDEREGLEDPATANAGTGRSHTQVQVPNASESQSPHAAIPPESGATPDVMQNNTIFQNAQGVNISGNTNFHNIGSVTYVHGGGKDGLENLTGFISFDAQFDSSAQDPDRQCHPGTRQNVLKRLRDWVDNPKSTERIFWLYGPAGAGKSAIAQTIARSYDRPKVAGTFFFFRSDANRNDGSRLFTTLAYQIALSMPEIREHIAHSLSERPDLPRTDVKTQFKKLLARPFCALSESAMAPVIIIDGVDECIDENLQRQFLEVIGDALSDVHFPLRFLIVSRPEVHIQQTIRRFQDPILTIDLAKLDDANRDIKKYLVDEFSRIASEQGLDPTWPGQEIIDDIVYKSSGNFIFASLVIRFVGDPYCFAKAQLEIVLNIKPPKRMSPFAILDQLFLEILRRVPDQEFLKRYLALLVARISVGSSDYGKLYEDDAVLMHVSKQELRVNLRRMRSLLKFKPIIDVHHKSFLDFLHDSSRSGQYYIRKQGGIKGYLEVFVDSLVRYIFAVIEQPNPHSALHFAPRFREKLKWYPLQVQLHAEEWREVTQPLLDLQDKLLQIPNFSSPWDLLPFDTCTAFHLMRELLHIGLHLGLKRDASIGRASVRNLRKRRDVISSITTKTKNMNDNDLDSLLMSLFAHLSQTKENWSPDKRVIRLLSAVLRFDYAETVMKVRSISDAQKLVDLLEYVIHAKNVLHPDARRKASLLALKVFARVPIVPLSYFLNDDDLYTSGIHIEILSQTLFARRILDHSYIEPLLRANGAFDYAGRAYENSSAMHIWPQRLLSSSATQIQIMLQLAKAIQYLHSMGVVLDRKFHGNVLLEDLYPKVCCWYSTSQSLLDKEMKERFLPHHNIFSFGSLCYELYAGATVNFRRRVPERPSGIPEYAWQLILRCCAKDPKCRPTIDEVVKEIESWDGVGHVELDEVTNRMQNWRGGEVANRMDGRHVEHVDPDKVVTRQDETCFGALGSFLSNLGRSLCQ